MPTAIIIAHKEEGFFIAADGRSRSEDHGVWTVHRNDEEKIIPIVGDRASFAFAVTGMARFTPDDDDTDVIFDFNLEVPRIADKLRSTTFPDALSYCKRLAEETRESLAQAVTGAHLAGKPVSYPNNPGQFGDDLIAYLILCGYYNRTPYGAVLEYFHRNQSLAAPETIQRFAVRQWNVFGSPEVTRLIYHTSDPRFSEFRSLLPGPDLTFLEWASLAKSYVSACESDLGSAVDPQFAPGIGGRVHAATVTRADGFKWIPGFEPISKI